MTTELAILRQIEQTGQPLVPTTEDESLSILRTCAKQYYNTIYPRNIQEVLNTPSCTLGHFQRAESPVKARALIAHMIIDLVKFLNVGKTMNAEQVAQTAEIILYDYAYLKVEDFKLCFSKAKKGLYGKTYDRIDGQVILDFLNTYVEERIREADNQSYNDHLRAKRDVDNTLTFTEMYFKRKRK